MTLKELKQRQRYYLRQVLAEIKQARETPHAWRSENAENSAHGMLAGGLNLGVLPPEQFDRLWDLASNAGQFRRRELRNHLPLYTWKEQPAVAQEAAA